LPAACRTQAWPKLKNCTGQSGLWILKFTGQTQILQAKICFFTSQHFYLSHKDSQQAKIFTGQFGLWILNSTGQGQNPPAFGL